LWQRTGEQYRLVSIAQVALDPFDASTSQSRSDRFLETARAQLGDLLDSRASEVRAMTADRHQRIVSTPDGREAHRFEQRAHPKYTLFDQETEKEPLRRGVRQERAVDIKNGGNHSVIFSDGLT
jgi:hypothetical protein